MEVLTYIDEHGKEKKDLLNVNKFIEDFDMMIKNTTYGVYGLTGGWGTGKSIFINIWERTYLKNNYIHIDAFKQDYENDAFLVLFSHIYQYLEKQEKLKTSLKELMKASKDYLLNIGKALGKFGLNVVSDKCGRLENYSTLINAVFDSYVDDILKKSIKQTSPHKEIVKTLKKITEHLTEPLYIIVDELDRCRPTFALEMLEKIKHIFSVPNIKFILVYNPAIFDKIIEKEYGLSNGGNKYLNKFIEKIVAIRYPQNLQAWLDFETSMTSCEKFSNIFYETLSHMSPCLLQIITEYNIGLRDLERIINKIKSIPNDNGVFSFFIFEILKCIDYTGFELICDHIKQFGEFPTENRLVQTFECIVNKIHTNGTSPYKFNINNEDLKKAFIYFARNGLITI